MEGWHREGPRTSLYLRVGALLYKDGNSQQTRAPEVMVKSSSRTAIGQATPHGRPVLV